MGMTEKQGGTDVRANTTTPAGWRRRAGRRIRITGHKWFMSAPMCDAFLVLAQAPGGLSCFLVPRFLPDGSVNALRFQRLKDKLGNRSNASSEVEFQAAHAWLVGEEGRGVPTIIEMVTLTRLDCAVASAGADAPGAGQCGASCRHRTVFRKTLVDQPLMHACWPIWRSKSRSVRRASGARRQFSPTTRTGTGRFTACSRRYAEWCVRATRAARWWTATVGS